MKTRIGALPYVLGVAAWLGLEVSSIHHDLVRTATFELPLLLALVPSITVLVILSIVAAVQARMTRRLGILATGVFGALLAWFGVMIASSLIANFVWSTIKWNLAPMLLMIPLGLVMSLPAMWIRSREEQGARSHDDGDRVIALFGILAMASPILITLVANLAAKYVETIFALEGGEMILMNAGAAIVAFGFGRSALRRQWINRARRGEIEGIRVRILAPAEARPRVLPMVPLADDSEVEVIEVVEHAAQSAYRSAELVQPIALSTR